MELWYLLARKALATAWQRRWLVVATAWLVCLVGWVGVFLIPQSYESQARLYVDTDAILTPLLHGLAIDTTTASQLEIMQKTLLSRPNLDKLIDTTPLTVNATTVVGREGLIAALGQQTKVESEGRNLFTISYRNRNPQLAHDVVAGLINIFLDRATASNQADMANARKFLQEQIESYEQQLRAAEQRRADFIAKYLDILPLENNGGSKLDAARIAVRDLETQLNDATAKRDALKQEASITSPVLDYTGKGPGSTANQDQLLAAEQKLAELRTRLTDENPDVIAQKRLIEALSKGLAAGPGGPKITLPNPLYERVRVQLIDAEATVQSLTSRLATARADLARMEDLARAAPHVAAEYENLDRDYSILKKNYEEFLARRETSNITAAADTGADKVRLRIIDPPQVPTIPAAPNRMMLITLVLLGGLGSAGAVAVALSQVDRSVGDIGHLRDLGFPVLGGISKIGGKEARSVGYGPQLRIAVMIIFLFMAYGGLAGHVSNIHWFI